MNGAGLQQGNGRQVPTPRRPSDIRNGVIQSISSAGTGSTMSLAEKFEDEKRRIIESCFSKHDEENAQIESYITHIRVHEDSAHPSTPAPPNSQGDKKPRVIIVAVRKSGRVRIHKARENQPSGSFSIGKTWNLDDLTKIQSFTARHGTTPQDYQFQSWAGSIGFVVFLGKPYYWAAASSKEKDFFVSSLVKIYRKYTGGKIPELTGFTPNEIEQITGAPPNRLSPGPQVQPSSPRPAQQSVATPPPPATTTSSSKAPLALWSQSRNGQRAPSRSVEQERVKTDAGIGARGPQSTTSREDFRPPTRPENRAPSSGSNREPGVARETSLDRQVPGAFDLRPPQRSQFTPKTSQQSQQSSSGSPASKSGVNDYRGTPPPRDDRQLEKLAPGPNSDSPGRGSDADGSFASQPSTATSTSRVPEPPKSETEEPQIPEIDAIRPANARAETSYAQKSLRSEDTSTFVTPLSTPQPSKESIRTPSKKPTENNYNDDTPQLSIGSYFAATLDPAEANKSATSTPTTELETTPVAENHIPPIPEERPVRTASPETISADQKDEKDDQTTEKTHRPGLGPMIKKKSTKDVADAFRKAAMAANAFKPRAGGAGARLMAQKDKPTSNEPDGITGVVPAPVLRGMSSDSAKSGTPDITSPIVEKERSFSPLPVKLAPKVQLERTATEDSIKSPVPQREIEPPRKTVRTQSPDKARSRSPTRRRRMLQQANIEKYCNALSVDSKIIEGRGGDFDDMLTELGWEGKLTEQRTLDDFLLETRREIGRAQATGWLGHIEQQEGKVENLRQLFDRTIEECEELDGLLTLYAHELDTLKEDVDHIEAQSQGLQVQTANQKLLKQELEKLLHIIRISAHDLRILKITSLNDSDGIRQVEAALALLYQAMAMIDPEIRSNQKRQLEGGRNVGGVGVYADTEIGQMRAVREKKDEYREEVTVFLGRLNQRMSESFAEAEHQIKASLEQTRSIRVTSIMLDTKVHDEARNQLWMFQRIMLFVREVNSYEWQTLINSYEMRIRNTYADLFREHVMACKKPVPKSHGEELDFLFTTQEKEKPEEGIAMAARKLTVKRGKTVKAAVAARSYLIGGPKSGEIPACEAFAGAIYQQTGVMADEQNFCICFFYLSSHMPSEFADIAKTKHPIMRKIMDGYGKAGYDPDREMAKVVERLMESIFAFWPGDMQNFIDWVLANDKM